MIAINPVEKSVVPYQDLPLAERDREWTDDRAVRSVREWASDGEGEKENIDCRYTGGRSSGTTKRSLRT